MYFLGKYILSSVPSVRIFPLLNNKYIINTTTTKSIVLLFFAKYPLIDSFSFWHVIVNCYSWVILGVWPFLYSTICYVTGIFPKAFSCRYKTFFTWSNNFVCAISIFYWKAVVDTVHCQRENKKISKKLVNSITIKSHGLF